MTSYLQCGWRIDASFETLFLFKYLPNVGIKDEGDSELRTNIRHSVLPVCECDYLPQVPVIMIFSACCELK